MVLTVMPLVGAIGGNTAYTPMEVYAAAGDGSQITFEYVNGDTDVSWVKNYSDFSELTANQLVAGKKYLAWDGSKYRVYSNGASATPSIADVAESLAFNGSDQKIGSDTYPVTEIQVENANGATRTYSVNDVGLNTISNTKRGNFLGDTTPTTAASTNATGVLGTITTSAYGPTDVSETATATTPSGSISGLTFLVGVDSRANALGAYDSLDSKVKGYGDFLQNVTTIRFVNKADGNNFEVYSQIGDGGNKTLVKSYSLDELNALAQNNKAGFLAVDGSAWKVYATNKYIPIEELINDAGLLYNSGDKITATAADFFASTQTYEAYETEKYFYTAAGPTTNDVATVNPIEVGTVLALNWATANVSGTAASTLNVIDDFHSQTRFYCGLSEGNYTNKTAAGNRFSTGPIELTVIKDVADSISGAAVILPSDAYVTDGAQIKPVPTVELDGITLKEGSDYTVAYGANNKVGSGNVTVTGKGNYTGTASASFDITEDAISLPEGYSIDFDLASVEDAFGTLRVKISITATETPDPRFKADKIFAFDIVVTDDDGQPIQPKPGKAVRFTLVTPDDFLARGVSDVLKIGHIGESGLEILDTKIEAGPPEIVIFDAAHFSPYALLLTAQETANPSVPKTSDSMNLMLFTILLAASALCLVTAFVVRRRVGKCK
jgi:hypothetical protein